MAVLYCSVKTESVVKAISKLFITSLEFAVKVSLKLSKIMSEPKTSVKVRNSCVQLAAALVSFDEELNKRPKNDAMKESEAKLIANMECIWTSVDQALKASENSSSSSVSSGIPTDPAVASLKVESLHFLQAYLAASSFGLSSRKHAVATSSTMEKCISDTYVHSASEALRVIPIIMKALQGQEESGVVDGLATAVVAKFNTLGTSNLEYEVKECALAALVSVVTIGARVISASVFKDKCLPAVNSALQNETSRTIGIKAMNEIASCPSALDISSVAGSAIDMFTKLAADKSNKQQRQSALAAAAAVLKHEAGSSSIGEDRTVRLLETCYPLISNDDLYLSHLVISVAANAISCCSSPKVKKAFADSFMDPVKNFIKTQPLQGATLASFMLCFSACGKNGVFSSPKDIVESFTKLVAIGETTKQIVVSVAAICAAYIGGIPDASARKGCIDQLLAKCKETSTPENQTSQCFSMFTIGQVGRNCDLADMLKVILHEIAKPAFDAGSDDIRTAAASMLGSVAAGSIAPYIKAIESWSREAPDSLQYYVLATLREFSSRLVEASNTAGCAQVCMNIAKVVKELVSNEDEGKRNIAAECLGKLCALSPDQLCSVVLSMASDANKECRTIAGGAVRVMYSTVISGKGLAAWQCENKPKITRFIFDNAGVLFGLIGDAEVQVRHVSLLTINYVLHQNSAELIPEDVLKVIAPKVLGETSLREELVEVVQYGPHKVRQDHGMEARKAAYECLSALLDAYPDVLNIKDVMGHLGAGLADEYDIVLLAIQICCKLASSPLSSAAMIEHVDKTLKPAFDSIVFPRNDGKKKSQDEEERIADKKKKIMRVFALLRKISGINDKAPDFFKFLNQRIISAPALSAMLKEAEESLNSK